MSIQTILEARPRTMMTGTSMFMSTKLLNAFAKAVEGHTDAYDIPTTRPTEDHNDVESFGWVIVYVVYTRYLRYLKTSDPGEDYESLVEEFAALFAPTNAARQAAQRSRAFKKTAGDYLGRVQTLLRLIEREGVRVRVRGEPLATIVLVLWVWFDLRLCPEQYALQPTEASRWAKMVWLQWQAEKWQRERETGRASAADDVSPGSLESDSPAYGRAQAMRYEDLTRDLQNALKELDVVALTPQ